MDGGDGKDRGNTVTEPADQPVAPRKGRSLTGFYVAMGVAVALALFGGWLWRTWTVWWFDADEARHRQTEAAARLGVPLEKAVDLGDGIKLELVLVPAGHFQMGSPAKEKDRRDDETQHWVMITRPFYIGKYEVTQEQRQKVTGTVDRSHFGGATNPVDCVNWDDCQEFLKKLNALGEEQGRFRLPTEAEWEWACRAGTRTRFCCGDSEEVLADYAWFSTNSDKTTSPVGITQPNAWGLHDMHGNVLEWCGDWYGEDYYAKSPMRDPTGPATGSERVMRGGAYYVGPRFCRSSSRFGNGSRLGADSRGLRVVLIPPGQ